MSGLEWDTIALLTGTAFLAGFIDSIAGGGGLLTVPALLIAGVDPVTAVATNKVQGTLSIVSALVTYGRKGFIEWRASIPMGLVALVFGGCGALLIQFFSKEVIAALIPILLISVALYFGLMRGVGDADRKARVTLPVFLSLIIPPLALYDGFLGPGAGSFYAAVLIGLLGLGITRMTAMAKVLNGGSNLGSLIVYSIAGAVHWPLGLAMGLASITGAQIGSHLAVRQGARLIRPLIVITCCALSIKMLADPANPLHWLFAFLPFPG